MKTVKKAGEEFYFDNVSLRKWSEPAGVVVHYYPEPNFKEIEQETSIVLSRGDSEFSLFSSDTRIIRQWMRIPEIRVTRLTISSMSDRILSVVAKCPRTVIAKRSWLQGRVQLHA